jgi:antitoxin component YwqK of YwqJK toxin-antitoxin module
MRQLFITIFLFLTFIGCKTSPINQKENKEREGLWIEEYNQDDSQYKSIGKYHKGDPIKRWRYYLDNKIIMREKYKDDYCIRTCYHQNGKIQSKGKTKLIVTDSKAHWFYSGDWKYYDEKGKLISTNKYENGQLVSETKTLLKK